MKKPVILLRRFVYHFLGCVTPLYFQQPVDDVIDCL